MQIFIEIQFLLWRFFFFYFNTDLVYYSSYSKISLDLGAIQLIKYLHCEIIY